MRPAWEAFRDSILEHMRREEEVVPKLLSDLARRAADRDEVVDVLKELLEEHRRLHELAEEVRAAVVGIPPLRSCVLRVLADFHEHAAEEDTEVYPELLAVLGVSDSFAGEPVMEHYRDGSDISRALRSAGRADPPPPEGVLARFAAMFRR